MRRDCQFYEIPAIKKLLVPVLWQHIAECIKQGGVELDITLKAHFNKKLDMTIRDAQWVGAPWKARR